MDAQIRIGVVGRRTKESWAERRRGRRRGKRASTPKKVLCARGTISAQNEESPQQTAGGGEGRSHGGKRVGKESKIMKQRRKTPRRKALERWWSFNWLLSAFLCQRKLRFRRVWFGRTAFLFPAWI